MCELNDISLSHFLYKLLLELLLWNYDYFSVTDVFKYTIMVSLLTLY